MHLLRIPVAIALLASLAIGADARATDNKRLPLRILYLSRADNDKRTAALTEFLTLHFKSCRTESRGAFRAELAANVDVVVLDWSQSERQSSKVESPIGPLEDWKRPLVLLGSAGLLLSEAWQIIGDAG